MNEKPHNSTDNKALPPDLATVRKRFRLKKRLEPIDPTLDNSDISELLRGDPKDRLGKIPFVNNATQLNSNVTRTWINTPVARIAFKVLGIIILMSLAYCNWLFLRYCWHIDKFFLSLGLIVTVSFWWWLLLEIKQAGWNNHYWAPRWLSRWHNLYMD